ncbi:MAG: histidine kinase, partial [Campylobacteraceae bacterium]|nr:histidine kinase [Campylobacteraceae bacterium]
EKNSSLFIELYDNALGIPFKIKDKIYEPYFSTKENKSGTGIGLYMSLLIIEKHFSGKITNHNYEYVYEGEKLIGEKFIIELPIS